MPDSSHARNAKARASQQLAAGKISAADYAKVVRKADRIIAKCEDDMARRTKKKTTKKKTTKKRAKKKTTKKRTKKKTTKKRAKKKTTKKREGEGRRKTTVEAALKAATEAPRI